jgi:hypothetical protein
MCAGLVVSDVSAVSALSLITIIKQGESRYANDAATPRISHSRTRTTSTSNTASSGTHPMAFDLTSLQPASVYSRKSRYSFDCRLQAKYASAAENSVHKPRPSSAAAAELTDPSLIPLARLLSSPTCALPSSVSVSQSSTDSIIGAVNAMVQKHTEVSGQLKQLQQSVESELESLKGSVGKFKSLLSATTVGSSMRAPILTAPVRFRSLSHFRESCPR